MITPESLLTKDHPLRAALRERGLSQRAFADKVGLSDSSLSQLLSGARKLSAAEAAQMAAALEVDLYDVFRMFGLVAASGRRVPVLGWVVNGGDIQERPPGGSRMLAHSVLIEGFAPMPPDTRALVVATDGLRPRYDRHDLVFVAPDPGGDPRGRECFVEVKSTGRRTLKRVHSLQGDRATLTGIAGDVELDVPTAAIWPVTLTWPGGGAAE
jgi:transcriptional regulator with XRE-family HTH domain